MKYDFSRCDNLQFKAKNEKGPMTGYLRVTKEGTVYIYTDCAYNESFDSSLQLETRDYEYRVDIEDFSEWAEDHELEIIPRDPETYKDWKVGDRVRCMSGAEVVYVIAAKLGEVVFLSKSHSQVLTLPINILVRDFKLILTDYEQELLAEKKKEKCPFKEGDNVLVKDDGKFWRFDKFRLYNEGEYFPYVCFSAVYKQCIPLNEHTWRLLGTTDEYKEEE